MIEILFITAVNVLLLLSGLIAVAIVHELRQ
jgi:hypothetical protein